MIAALADTHAVIWYLSNDVRLSAQARATMQTAADDGNQIAVSSISLIEMVYLVEKARISGGQFSQLISVLRDPTQMLLEIPVNAEIARMMTRIPFAQVSDMPDRVIAATALHLNVPLISRDRKIQLKEIVTVW